MPRILPEPTPETRHFWEGCRRGALVLQRCVPCARAYFPPRPFCPHCGGGAIERFEAGGRATLYSYVIVARPRPDMGTAPHSIAVVTLEEGPRMMTNVVNCPQTPEALRLDMPLRVVFAPQDDAITLPLFEPAPPAGALFEPTPPAGPLFEPAPPAGPLLEPAPAAGSAS